MKYSTFILFFLLAIPISLLAQTSSYSISNVNTSCGSGTTGTGTPCGLEYFGSNIKLSSSPSMGGSGSTTLSVSINRCTGTTALVGQVYLKMSNSSSISDVVCGTNIAQNLNGNASTLTLSADLGSLFTSGTRYFTMVFINSTGVRSYSRVFSVTATPPSCNIQTSSGFASSITASSFTANWNAVLGATNYQMSYTTNSDINYTNALNYTQTTTSRTLSNLFSSTSYRFRVRAQCSNGLYGPWVEVSNITTAAPPPPTITLTNPPTDSWGFGQTRSLSWSITNNGCGPYNVEVSTNAGSSWILIGRGISGTSMNWTVGKDVNDNPIPNMLNNPNLRVKVYCQNNTSISTQSTTFSLAVPSITVTTPQALTTGQTQNITWTVNNAVCTQFTVELSTNGGSTPWNVLKTFHPQTSLSWTIPNDQNGNAISSAVGSSTNRLKVYCSGYDAISGTSGNFSVSTPSCNLTLPAANTGTVSNIASAGFTATWPAISGATEYRINVATINNTTYSAPLSFTGLTTTNSINVTGLSPSTQYRYQIQAKCANGVWTSWSSTLATPTTNGPLSLTQLTGATWHCTKTIQWTSQPNIGNVTIELGNTNTGIIGVIGTNLPNTGSYDWVVGKRMLNGNTVDFENFDFTQTYYLKIYPTGTANQASTGNGFTIPRPTISVSSPAANSTFNAGQTITMNYVSQNLCGPMTVELTNSSGTTLQVMPNGSNIANASPYTFTVTNTFPQPGTYRLKIYPTVSGGNSPAVGLSEVFTVGGNTTCSTCITGQTVAVYTQTGQEGFCAAQYLCGKGIIDNNITTSPTAKILRQDLAKVTLLSILADSQINTVKNGGGSFPADYYPTTFTDLFQGSSTSYHRYAKLLSYLQGSDTAVPFDREKPDPINSGSFVPRFTFEPTGFITRADLIKVFLETWNIDESTATNVSVPYNDISTLPIATQNYIRKAFQLGIISGQISFRPTEDATREEAFLILARMRQNLTLPEASYLTSASNYYQPLNQSIGNLSIYKGLTQGNFSHHSSTDFGINDIGFSLNFAHNYQSFLTLLPDELKVVSPLGEGWTHPYNVYMFTTTQLNDSEGNVAAKPLLVLVWGDGTMDVYDNTNINSPTPITIGTNYNTLTRVSSNQYTIKSKSQHIYTFNQQGTEAGLFRLTSIRDRYNNTLSIVYKTGSMVQFSPVRQVIDYIQTPSGRRINFTYDSQNRITNINFPGANSNTRNLTFTYTGRNLTSFKDAKGQSTGKTTTYTYGTGTERYLLKQITFPRGNKIENVYDPNSRLRWTQTRDANNNVTAKTDMGPSGYGTFNSDGSVTNNWTQDCSCPNAQSSAKYDKNGITTEFQNKVIKVLSPANANHPSMPREVTYSALNGSSPQTYTPSYDSNGNVLSISRPDGKSETFTYDIYHNRRTHTDAKGITTTYNWSADGKYLNSIVRPIGNGSNLTQTFGYLPNGLMSSSTNNENIVTNFGYDTRGNMNSIQIPVLNISSSAVYDFASRMTSNTNARGKTTSYVFDDNDNLTRETDPLSRQTNYGYDDNDNLITITNAKNEVTTLGYDGFDRLISETFGGKTKTYVYDNAQNRLVEFRKAGYVNNNTKRFSYTYDANNRLYGNGYITEIGYDPLNRMSSIKGGTQASHQLSNFSYDALNRLTGYTDAWNNTVGYGYDDNGNETRIDYPNGNKLYKTYDNLNRLKTLTWNSTLVATYNYVGSRLDNVVYGNNVKTQYSYDNAGRPTGISTKTNNGTGSTLYAATFTLDNLGNHTEENETQPFATLPVPTAGTTSSTFTNNRINNLGSTNFTHDDDGNITAKGSSTYGYDLEDNLTSYTGSGLAMTALYDAFGNRRSVTRNGTETRYVLDMNGLATVLAETNSSNTVQNYYLHGLGLVARVKADGTLHYYHGDFRGSTIAMTNASQTITHKYQYDEFGNLTNSQEADPNPFRYVGAYGIMHESPDLTYMRARYYDPTTGRFNSEDPIWHVNLYPYAGNNPIMRVDPNGELAFLLVVPLVTTITAVAGQIVVNKINQKKWYDGIGFAAAGGLLAGTIALFPAAITVTSGYGTASFIASASFGFAGNLIANIIDEGSSKKIQSKDLGRIVGGSVLDTMNPISFVKVPDAVGYTSDVIHSVTTTITKNAIRERSTSNNKIPFVQNSPKIDPSRQRSIDLNLHLSQPGLIITPIK